MIAYDCLGGGCAVGLFVLNHGASDGQQITVIAEQRARSADHDEKEEFADC